MGLTDRFNPFSVGQTCETQRNNTKYSQLFGARATCLGENHFSLFETMSLQQCRESVLLQEEQLTLF